MVVAYGVPEEDRQRPIMAASLPELATPAWWRQSSATHAVLGGGLDPVFLPVCLAAREANVRTVLTLDSGGCLLPRHGSWTEFARDTLTQYLDYRPRPGYVGAVIRILYYCLFQGRIGRRHLRFFATADWICTVSPLAQSRIRRRLTEWGRDDLVQKVMLVPHPVRAVPAGASLPPSEKQIVSVGRWGGYAKNAALLVRSLVELLDRIPDCQARIVGADMETIEFWLRRSKRWPAERIVLAGFMNHADLLNLYSRSQVFFLPSRSESYNISAAEALCCGCSVVAPAHLPTASWFCGRESGTVAGDYTAAALADGLAKEMGLWAAGRRDSGAISRTWINEVGVERCAQRMLDAMGISSVRG